MKQADSSAPKNREADVEMFEYPVVDPVEQQIEQ